VNATNHGDAVGAATIICKLVALSATYIVDQDIELGPGKNYSFVTFMFLPEVVILKQGQESVAVLQN